MNIRDYFYKETETEKIHKELFKTTSEYQYYLFGIAFGLYSIYDTCERINDNKISGIALQDVIKHVIDNFDVKELKTHFNRMIEKKEEKDVNELLKSK